MSSQQPPPPLYFCKLTEEAYTPTRATSIAAGLDLFSPFEVVIPSNEKVSVSTNIRFKFPRGGAGGTGYCRIIKSRSGLCFNHHITVEDGGFITADNAKEEIKIILYNHGKNEYKVRRGDRIAQLICQEISFPANLYKSSFHSFLSFGTMTTTTTPTTNARAIMEPILYFYKTTPEAYAPTRPTPNAAGLDLYSPFDVVVPNKGKVLISTKLQLTIPENCYGNIESTKRSGLCLNHHITVEGGVIDRDYMGEIKVILYNHGENEYKVKRGDCIAQIIFNKICFPTLVEEIIKQKNKPLENGERGCGGFGSTGK